MNRHITYEKMFVGNSFKPEKENKEKKEKEIRKSDGLSKSDATETKNEREKEPENQIENEEKRSEKQKNKKKNRAHRMKEFEQADDIFYQQYSQSFRLHLVDIDNEENRFVVDLNAITLYEFLKNQGDTIRNVNGLGRILIIN